jgi:exonuclease III
MTWNILHGGGARRLPEIILSLVAHRPDVVLLTEFRVTRGSQIRAALADHGLEHQIAARGASRVNGLLLASRTPVRPAVVEDSPGQGRWLGAELTEQSILVGGVHVPDDTCGPEKTAYWQFLLRAGRLWREKSAIFLGDFNTGRRRLDGGPKGQRCEKLLGSFVSLGYTDAWRTQHPEKTEFSWFSHEGQGWRIDTAYLSPPLRSTLQTAWYSQVEREAGFSDHAPLLLELALAQQHQAGSAAGAPRRHKAGLFGHSGVPAG